MLANTKIRTCLLICCLPSLLLMARLNAAENLPPGWVEHERPSSGTSSNTPAPVCRGSYVWKKAVGADDSNIKLRAAEVTNLNDSTIMRGGVEVISGNTTLNSDEAIYYKEEQLVQLTGRVQINSPNLIARTEDTFYYIPAEGEEENIQLLASEFSQPASHIHGSSSELTQKGSIIELKDASISFCDPDENTWHLESRSLRLNLNTMQGNARGAKFYLGKAPVMYFPYLPFPIGDERQTGFLYPNVNIDSRAGFEYSQPLYINIAPNYDSTFYFHAIQNRGLLLEQDFRWLTSAGTGTLGYGYIAGDALYKDDKGKADERYTQHFDFSSVVKDGWAGDITWTGVSDREYTDDLPTFFTPKSDLALPRQAQIRYADKWADWTLGLRDYQVIANDDSFFTSPYKQLPYTRLELYSPTISGFYLSNSIDYSAFEFDKQGSADEGSSPVSNIEGSSPGSNIEGSNIWSGNNGRLHNDLTLGWGYTPYWGNLKARLNWQLTDYQLQEQNKVAGSSEFRRNHNAFDVDSSLIFSTLLQAKSCNCYFTFQPRLYALSSEQDVSETPEEAFDAVVFDTTHKIINYDYLFSPERYVGFDRDIAEKRVSVGIESGLINLAGTDEYRFRLGKVISADIDEQVADNAGQSNLYNNLSDPWSMDISWRIGERSYMDVDITGDDKGTHSYGSALRYANAKKSGVSVIYRHQQGNFYQTEADQIGNNFVWYPVPRWSWFGGWRYDLLERKSVNAISGFGYENCCFSTRLGVYQKLTNNKQDNGVLVQFNFIPLGSFGAKSSSYSLGGIEYIYDEFNN